jgi:hypothetical protein
VRTKTPGKWDVEIAFACEDGAAGSEYAVSVGDQKVVGKIDGTGGWEKFVTRKIGSVVVANAGEATLSLKAASMPHGAVMNLQLIRLTPAK